MRYFIIPAVFVFTLIGGAKSQMARSPSVDPNDPRSLRLQIEDWSAIATQRERNLIELNDRMLQLMGQETYWRDACQSTRECGGLEKGN